VQALAVQYLLWLSKYPSVNNITLQQQLHRHQKLEKNHKKKPQRPKKYDRHEQEQRARAVCIATGRVFLPPLSGGYRGYLTPYDMIILSPGNATTRDRRDPYDMTFPFFTSRKIASFHFQRVQHQFYELFLQSLGKD